MATSNDSPSLFSGQQWTDWAGSVLPDSETSNHDETVTEDIDTTQLCTATESMKLKTEDMPLFGVCPSRDEFYLVVCEKCNHVLKPQAFQAHLDVRHGGKGSHSTSTKSHHSSNRHSVSSKSYSPSKTHSESSHSKNQSSPNRSQLSQLPARVSPLKISTTELSRSGFGLAVNETVAADVKPPILTKVTVKEPVQLFNTAIIVGTDSDIAKDSKLNNNNSVPVVKVERMPETLAMKKQHESSGSARSSVTYGSVRGGGKFSPLPIAVINNIKPSLSPPPLLSSTQELDIGICDVHSMLDSAASSILEPVAPVLETDTGDFVALATSSNTLTTNTVTMASLTASTTSVTNVRNTSSSFTFSSAGRPHFPLGSIRVHFSSSGVLSTIAKEGNNNNNNSINSSKSSSGSSITNDTIRSSLCSNGSMESTISDIVKSAVNSRNTGGFKNLSPLLISPSKGTNSLSNHSFKSPSKLANIVNSSGYAKSGTQLIGSSNVFKSLSSGSLPPATKSSSLTVVNTEAIKKFQLLNKPDKIIPLKDREYNANKHCGVIVAETGKPCTRSLTCKSHALSLRRSVTGRRLSFNDLLKEHKEAKEAYLKAKIESKEATAALKAAASANKGHAHHISSINRINSAPLMAPSIIKPNAHLNQTMDNKPLSLASFATSKPLTIQRPANLSAYRPSFGSISSQSSQDELQSPTSMKSSDQLFDVEDGSYTICHPRPIAACSFGARNHNKFGSGFGCYTFNRRSDHMRSTFLDLLDKHTTEPSPPKKLCLDVNIPLEQPDLVCSTSDQFDFSYLDPSLNILGQPVIPGPTSSISSVHNRVLSMQKSKSESACCTSGPVSGSKPKLKDNICSPTSAGVSGCVNLVTPTLFTGSSAKKRRGSGCGTSHNAGSGCDTSHNAGSGCGTSQNAINVHTNLGTTLVTAPSILTNIGTITNTSGVNATQFAIAIPGVNISHISANLGTSLASKHAKNNVIKDIGNIIVTGFPHDLLNGQLVNITNSHLPTEIPLHQVQSVTQEDSNKSLQQFSAINNSNSFLQQKFINGIDIRALQTGKAGIFTSLPPNAVLLDSNLQSGTVLHPVTLTAATTASVSGAMLSHQSNPATSANTLYRLNCASPHMSTSSVPNGVTSHSTDKELMTSQRHTVFQTKAASQCAAVQQSRPSFPLQSHMFTGSQLHNSSFMLQAPNSDTLSNESSGSARHFIPNQLAQLQIKNTGLLKQGINKLTMQPMSITIPFVTQNSIGGVEMGVANQQHTHTLYITSDDNQGVHLEHSDQSQAHNSPTSSLIS